MKRMLLGSLLSCMLVGQVMCGEAPAQRGSKIAGYTVLASLVGCAASGMGLLKAVSNNTFLAKISFLGNSSPAIASNFCLLTTALSGGLAIILDEANKKDLRNKQADNDTINIDDSDTFPMMNKIARVASGALMGSAIGSFMVAGICM